MGQALGAARGGRDGDQGRGRRVAHSGVYFGENFTLAGQEFQTMTPESFLFGDMADLNFLSQISGIMPRVPPQVKHTNTLRALVNVHKNSVRLVRHADAEGPLDSYHVAFSFDADCECSVTLHPFVQEVVAPQRLDFEPYRTDVAVKCDTTHFPAGFGQAFSDEECVLNGLQALTQEELDYRSEGGKLFFPLVIEVAANAGQTSPASTKHCQVTYCALEKGHDGAISVRVVAQKVHIDGTTYLLREIYGLEQKQQNGNGGGNGDDGQAEHEDSDAEEEEEDLECVVCMSSPMDTMVLPCRHLCLCNDCAEVLRHQSSKCPICRAAFHSVLRLRVAVDARELSEEQLQEAQEGEGEEDTTVTPAGFQSVPVVSAMRAPAASDGAGYPTVGGADGGSSSTTASPAATLARTDTSNSNSHVSAPALAAAGASETNAAATTATTATNATNATAAGERADAVEMLDVSDRASSSSASPASPSSLPASAACTTVNVQPSPAPSPDRPSSAQGTTSLPAQRTGGANSGGGGGRTGGEDEDEDDDDLGGRALTTGSCAAGHEAYVGGDGTELEMLEIGRPSEAASDTHSGSGASSTVNSSSKVDLPGTPDYSDTETQTAQP